MCRFHICIQDLNLVTISPPDVLASNVSRASADTALTWAHWAHWGRETHICASKLTGQHPAVIWTNAGIIIIGTQGTNPSKISIEIHTCVLKMSSAILYQPQCVKVSLGFNDSTTLLRVCDVIISGHRNLQKSRGTLSVNQTFLFKKMHSSAKPRWFSSAISVPKLLLASVVQRASKLYGVLNIARRAVYTVKPYHEQCCIRYSEEVVFQSTVIMTKYITRHLYGCQGEAV